VKLECGLDSVAWWVHSWFEWKVEFSYVCEEMQNLLTHRCFEGSHTTKK
jgi:hypothetical protein